MLKSGKAILIAPHHADCDLRVRRTISVVAGLMDTLDVFWDENYPGHQFINHATNSNVNEHYIERSNGKFEKFRFWRTGSKVLKQAYIQKPIILYIHSSGVQGLIIARMAKSKNPECIVIYDYHDSLAYELFYQLQKIYLGKTFKYVWTFYRVFLKYLSQSVDGIVGISTAQVNEFRTTASREIPSTVVPNIRVFNEFDVKERDVILENVTSFLWVGQVMAGRDLEKIAEWIENCQFETEFHVFGNIVNENTVIEIKKRLGETAVFHGEFKDEKIIHEKISGKVICVFLGWSDPYSTGINCLASPNKVFSYINLEMPVIVDRRLEGIAGMLNEYSAGIAVDNSSGFNEAAEIISKNYQKFRNGAVMLKKHLCKINPEGKLREFLKSTPFSKG